MFMYRLENYVFFFFNFKARFSVHNLHASDINSWMATFNIDCSIH